MADNADVSPPAEPTAGRILAQRRKDAGLTGGQLGALVGMSQSKISRIENGKGQSDPADVGRLARQLGMAEPQVLHLMDQVAREADRIIDWRFTPIGLPWKQASVGGVEKGVREIRVFQS